MHSTKTVRVIMAVLVVACALGWSTPGMASVYGPAPYQENLLTNPNGNSGNLSGWTVTSNGGDGWLATTGHQDYNEDNGFLTSFEWAHREQLVDLVARGFSPGYLDTQPRITISEIFEKVFCADYFFLTVDLLDSDFNLVHSWSSGVRQHGSTDCDYSGYKEKVSFMLAHYGTGVRYIRWRDGGKDSEWWRGHFGPKLQNAYLALAPANLLHNPSELSSWNVNSYHDFELTGPPEARQFRTSYHWGQRQQTIDLLALGFTASQLDSGELPILAEGTYREVACPDEYYLKVELLDQNQAVLMTQDSGIRVHDGECDWTYSEYGETVHHRFDNYPSGVRYIRWEDGGKDREYWSGHFGAILEAPYLGIVNNEAWATGAGRILEAWDYGLVSEDDDSATYVTPAKHRILVEMQARRTDPCDAVCMMNQIVSGLAQLDPGQESSLWDLNQGNTDIKVFANPKPPESDLRVSGSELRDAVKQTIEKGTTLIDITTLADINSEWMEPISDALKKVEENAAIHGRSPNVRIHLGLGGWEKTLFWSEGMPSEKWDSLRDVLVKVTSKLQGNTGMTVYISGGRRLGAFAPVNWNHSKIVAVDGKEAIVGGHNLWNVYFNPASVLDTSVKISGDSAWSAHLFVGELLRDHAETFKDSASSHSFYWWRRITSPVRSIDITLPARPTSGGNIQVLGVGQLSTDEEFNPLKPAVLNMVNAARESIYISQQSLAHTKHFDPYDWVDRDLSAALARKALKGRQN